MNLVDMIRDRISSELTGKLGSLVGENEERTSSALGAIVPALLAAFSKMTSGGGSGADQLAAAVNKFGVGSTEKLTSALNSDAEQALDQGNSLLGNLFGGSTLSGLVGALSRSVDLDGAIIKKLMAYASPLVLGTIAKQFQGKPPTAEGLTSLFAEQKTNIADAMPAGLSLADIPGSSDAGSTATRVASTAHHTAGAARETGTSFMKTLLPIAALALLGMLAWQFFRDRGEAEIDARQQVAEATERTTQRPVTEYTAQRPAMGATDAVPSVSRLSDDLTSFYATATDTLNGITDAASAEAALPKLDELTTKIDSLAAEREKLPATARSTIAKIAADNIGKLTALIEKVLDIPGVRDTLGPVLNRIETKLKAFEGDA